jgi:hypothetical protein
MQDPHKTYVGLLTHRSIESCSEEEEEEEEEEELHQSSQMRLIRRNTNTRIEYPSTNLETVINVCIRVLRACSYVHA